jgi:hypothetical protein
VLRKHSQSPIAPPVILLVSVPMRHILRAARNAFFLPAQSKELYVRSVCPMGTGRVDLLLTFFPVAQRWQKKACKAPYRNSGHITSRVGAALVTIAGLSVGVRFLARWKIQDSTVGWDDWTILASFILLIPSTILLRYSSSLQS